MTYFIIGFVCFFAGLLVGCPAIFWFSGIYWRWKYQKWGGL